MKMRGKIRKKDEIIFYGKPTNPNGTYPGQCHFCYPNSFPPGIITVG
jgi:hypothetical protein